MILYKCDSQFRGKAWIMEGGLEEGKEKERLKNNLYVNHILCTVLDDFRSTTQVLFRNSG